MYTGYLAAGYFWGLFIVAVVSWMISNFLSLTYSRYSEIPAERMYFINIAGGIFYLACFCVSVIWDNGAWKLGLIFILLILILCVYNKIKDKKNKKKAEDINKKCVSEIKEILKGLPAPPVSAVLRRIVLPANQELIQGEYDIWRDKDFFYLKYSPHRPSEHVDWASVKNNGEITFSAVSKSATFAISAKAANLLSARPPARAGRPPRIPQSEATRRQCGNFARRTRRKSLYTT